MNDAELCQGYWKAKDKAGYMYETAVKNSVSVPEVANILVRYGILVKGERQHNLIVSKANEMMKRRIESGTAGQSGNVKSFKAAKIAADAKAKANSGTVVANTKTVRTGTNSTGLKVANNISVEEILKSDNLIALIQDSLNRGFSAVEIAGMLGIDDVNIIYRACKNAGISIQNEKTTARMKKVTREELVKILNINEYVHSYLEMGSIEFAMKSLEEQNARIKLLLKSLQ